MALPPTESGEGDPGQLTRIAEQFIRQHEAGQLTDLDEFCARYPEDQREEVRAECDRLLRVRGVIGQPERLVGGQMLASYKILERIGRGGMGEVYRARDPKLERDIAIKVLPPDLACEPERVERFKREAKAIAALDHPNIVTVYSVEESGGRHFITMQLVQGKTLSELIPRKGMPLDKLFDLAIPLADAISSAHAQGITHRDLKPANIMVTGDGRVQILDFGLAKLRPPVSAERSTQIPLESLTGGGQVVGTVAYMSPEQAEGRDVDHRTDIFSLGIILYEMVTGRRPFQGDTRVALMSSIMKDTPTSVCQLNPQLPNHLGRIIRRSLEKDSERRFQTVKDLRNELEGLRGEVSSGEIEVGRVPLEARRPIWPGIALVLLALLVTVLLTQWFGEDSPANPLATATFRQITSFPGDEGDAAISRDGSWVAFLSDHTGIYDLWFGPVAGGVMRNRTEGRLGDIQPATLRGVGFNYDGSDLWLGPVGEEPMRFLPLLEGPARAALGGNVVTADWSRDGEIVYHTRENGDPLHVRRGTSSPMIHRVPDTLHQHQPVWSLDGSWIYFIGGRPNLGDVALWRIRPDGSERTQLTRDLTHVGYPTPISDRTVLFVAREPNGAGPWIWRLDVETLQSRRASIGMEQYTSLSASQDGRRLVATRANPEVSLWQVAIPEGPNEVATESDVESYARVSAVQAWAPRFSESEIYFLSSRGTGDGLWKHTEGDDAAVVVWDEGALVEPAAISPDGRIALIIREEGRLTLRIITDGEPRLVATDIEVRGAASWSPRGEWIAIGGEDDEGAGLFKVPVDGGEAVRLTGTDGLDPVWSPRDDLIFYLGSQAEAPWCPRNYFPLRAIRSNGDPVELPQIKLLRRGKRIRFLPDGSGLVYMEGPRTSQDFWLLPIESFKPQRLTRLDSSATMRTFDVTPDGRSIVFDRRRENSDLVVIDLAHDGDW